MHCPPPWPAPKPAWHWGDTATLPHTILKDGLNVNLLSPTVTLPSHTMTPSSRTVPVVSHALLIPLLGPLAPRTGSKTSCAKTSCANTAAVASPLLSSRPLAAPGPPGGAPYHPERQRQRRQQELVPHSRSHQDQLPLQQQQQMLLLLPLLAGCNKQAQKGRKQDSTMGPSKH